MTDFRRKTVG